MATYPDMVSLCRVNLEHADLGSVCIQKGTAIKLTGRGLRSITLQGDAKKIKVPSRVVSVFFNLTMFHISSRLYLGEVQQTLDLWGVLKEQEMG